MRVLLGVVAVAIVAGVVLVVRAVDRPALPADLLVNATVPAGQHGAVVVSDVRLSGDGGGEAVLFDGKATVKRAPDLTELATVRVAPGTYSSVRATVNGRVLTASLPLTVKEGFTPVVLVVGGGSLTAAAGNDDANHAVLLASGQIIHAPDVTFTDQAGRSVPLHSLRGKVVVVAALDAHCHDTCPLYTALWADLQSVVRERSWQDRVVLAEVSMDPDRDTPAELAAYARLTGATWPLLRADPDATSRFWTALGAAYVKAPSPSPAAIDWYTGKPETYHLHHDSLAVVFDQNGDARYILQGNPGLGHALSAGLARLLTSPAASLPATWSLTDLLDRVDTVLGVPTEPSRGAERTTHVGSRAPEIALDGLDGHPVRLGAQLGRPVVVTFWATWCVPCRHDMPLLAAAARSHPGLVVLAVDEGESSGQVRDYLQSVLGAGAAQLTTVLDPDHAAAAPYAARELPVTVFVGADGLVRAVQVGQLHDDDLAALLARTGA